METEYNPHKMTAKTTHLFFSLPEVLQSEIYQWDPTYKRTFQTFSFQEEINYHQILLLHKEQLNRKFYQYWDDILQIKEFEGNSIWYNEFGYFDFQPYSCHPIQKHKKIHQNRISFYDNGYQPHFFVEDGVIKFKILSLELSYEEKQFLKFSTSGYKNYDGFLCTRPKHMQIWKEEIPKPVPDASSYLHYGPAEFNDRVTFDVWVN